MANYIGIITTHPPPELQKNGKLEALFQKIIF